MAELMTMMETGLDFVTNIFTWLLGNPILLFLIACSLIPVGFKIFKTAKKSIAK